MRTYAIAYVVTAVVFLVLDGTWLSLTASTLYRPAIGSIMADKPELWAAVAFYVLYLFGMVVLVIAPALAGGGWATALRLGAVLGLVAYATYDLTNQAILRDWPARLTILDLIWGTFVTAVSAGAGTAITAWIVQKWSLTG